MHGSDDKRTNNLTPIVPPPDVFGPFYPCVLINAVDGEAWRSLCLGGSCRIPNTLKTRTPAPGHPQPGLPER